MAGGLVANEASFLPKHSS